MTSNSLTYEDYVANSTEETYGSFLSSYDDDFETFFHLEESQEVRPRLLLFGTHRSGKSSILHVVFHKMSPHETLFLESTQDIRVRDIHTSSSLLQLQVVDFPGNFDWNDKTTGNAQGMNSDPTHNFSKHHNITTTNADVAQSPAAATLDSGSSLPPSNSTVHPTSGASLSHCITPEMLFSPRRGSNVSNPCAIIFVIDAQDDENGYSESIDYFISLVKIASRYNSHLQFNVFIHKIDSDAFVSNNGNTVNGGNDEIQFEIQNAIKKQIKEELNEHNLSHISPNFHSTSIYDHTIFIAFSKIVQTLTPSLNLLEKLLDGLLLKCGMEKCFLFDILTKIYVATDSNPVDMQTYELCSDMIDVVIDVSCIYGNPSKPLDNALSSSRTNLTLQSADGHPNPDATLPTSQSTTALANATNNSQSVMSASSSVISLSNGYILYLREVSKYLSLVCLMKKESFLKTGVIEYNFITFKSAMADLLAAKLK